ncbi:hypothetical protein SAMN05421866_3505 [Chryseobacterium oranimense]|uniref:DUF6705 domain-containing protein n=1 Tax=Chryseobacterium oranimense TaxID=421058 RepID=A0A1M5V9Z2_9FLAO|nr:DUF6705 family protein [Chryseobacterium oranimense]SHH71904.1 hypothetical protein SAMN05421866_3505 [Chryseobacterium oranimense]
MKNKIVYILLLLGIISFKAQVIGTLEQFEECQKRPNRDEGCPDLDNITYVKDTNNRLNQFVGIWKGTYNGKQYEIHFEKQLQWGEDIKWDRIFGRIIIKDNSGNIIYNSLNKSLTEAGLLRGGNFQNRVYVMHFVGNYDCLESGNVFIETRINNPNEMTLFYSQDKDGLLNPAKCPNFSTFVPLLPTDKITLIKQ